MEPKLQILPAFMFLLLYQEHERQQQRPHGVLGSGAGGGGDLGRGAGGGVVLGSGAGGGGVLGSCAGGGGVLGSGAGGGGVLGSGAGGGLVRSADFPDLPVLLCPFPTLDGGAAVSTLPTVPLGAASVADFFPLSRRALANFLCFTGGGLSVLWLLATLAALLPGALQKPVTTGTTGPADVVAEVLGWDLERRALGD
ncbi:hypothetical protein NDU88_006568 [Pleurodeles waltl]|uniref:Uncharacterized protein n=1 Tax=Pleurodeles waltl TaxID=8319 RepID=A0AAV7NQP7_PLEWA|nr:hypothetical protein NDU88_006568 [Pleurodeles waltl]